MNRRGNDPYNSGIIGKENAMGNRIRSLKQQFNYAISQSCHIGESKRAYKGSCAAQGINPAADRIYSIQYAENLRDCAKSLSNFINERYPEVRMAKDIKSEYIQEWIDSKSIQWTQKTAECRVSQVEKLQSVLNSTYKIGVDWQVKPPETVKADKIRTVGVDRADFEKLREAMAESDCSGKTAMEITARTGLRIKEVARLHADRINLDKRVIEVREGAKNGKFRDVPIREKDLAFFHELKEKMQGQYVTRGVNEDTLNKGIRRGLQRAGLDKKYAATTNHALRKMYATERMTELQSSGMTERAAWLKVQQELGHGSQFRAELFHVYVQK